MQLDFQIDRYRKNKKNAQDMKYFIVKKIISSYFGQKTNWSLLNKLMRIIILDTTLQIVLNCLLCAIITYI